MRPPLAVNTWMRCLAARRVGDDEACRRPRRVERARIEDAALLRADLRRSSRASSHGDRVDGVGAPVEDEVLRRRRSAGTRAAVGKRAAMCAGGRRSSAASRRAARAGCDRATARNARQCQHGRRQAPAVAAGTTGHGPPRRACSVPRDVPDRLQHVGGLRAGSPPRGPGSRRPACRARPRAGPARRGARTARRRCARRSRRRSRTSADPRAR